MTSQELEQKLNDILWMGYDKAKGETIIKDIPKVARVIASAVAAEVASLKQLAEEYKQLTFSDQDTLQVLLAQKNLIIRQQANEIIRLRNLIPDTPL